MEKFEYLVKKELINSSTENQLNKLGEKGWELISTLPCPDKYAVMVFFYFKRKIIE